MKFFKEYLKKMMTFFKSGNERDSNREIIDAVLKFARPTELDDLNYNKLSCQFYVELYMLVFSLGLMISGVSALGVLCSMFFVACFAHTAMSFIKSRRFPSLLVFFQNKKTTVQRLGMVWGIVLSMTFLVILCHFFLLPQQMAERISTNASILYLFAFVVLPIGLGLAIAGESCGRLYKKIKKD